MAGRKCSVDGCERPHESRGYCGMHAQRIRRGQSLNDPERCKPYAWLQEYIAFRSDACLEWPFARHANGYGAIQLEGGPHVASRVMCEMAHGKPSAERDEAAHSCGNRGCVNPQHLRWATRVENAADRLKHGSDARGEKAWNCAITAEVALKIYRDSRPKKIVAADHKCSVSTVHNIRYGMSWAWLTGHKRAA